MGRRIKVKSGNASAIHCHYVVYGERKDGEVLIAEYEGEHLLTTQATMMNTRCLVTIMIRKNET